MGNLSFDVTRDELIQAFGAAGKVVDAKVPTDRETGRPRGFAFVEFEDDEAAQRSIALLNGKDLKGRPLRVNEAENRPPRPAGHGWRTGRRVPSVSGWCSLPSGRPAGLRGGAAELQRFRADGRPRPPLQEQGQPPEHPPSEARLRLGSLRLKKLGPGASPRAETSFDRAL